MPQATVLDALPFIRMASARLIRTLNSADYNQEDLQQEITLDVLRRIGQFDPDRGSLPRFVWIVAEHSVLNIRRKERAQCRDCRLNSWSVNERVAGDKQRTERGAGIDFDAYEAAFGRRSRSGAEVMELRHDVDRAVGGLPEYLKTVAVAVMFDSIDCAVEAIGTSRATIYRRMRALRDVFTHAGLHSYIRPAMIGRRHALRQSTQHLGASPARCLQ